MADGSSTAAGNDESEAGAYRNPIWNYFLKVPPGNEARCLKCKAVLKTPTGTTTTLATHLKRHPDSYKTFECERQARGSAVKHKNGSKPNHQQPSVADSFKPKLKPTAPKAKQMTAIIANFIASGMHPYSIVEESGFVEMMKLAMPDYTVPSRTTFSRVVIPDLYESKKKELRKSLRDIFSSGAECYSITTDGWTSRANNSYVSVTCHVMDEEFGQHVHALACTDMTDSHTAENLEQFIKSAIEDWELPAPGTMPIYVVTDNARNFTSAFARSPWSGVQCFGHTLQLCISNAKKEVAGFSQLCAKARTIVARYKRSAKARGRLMEIQKNMNLEPLEVVQDVPTRWNSEHAMMKRLVKLRVPVSVELSECDTVEPLSASEWRLMAAVVQVLQPLEQATAELSGDSYPTLSQVIPLLECTKVVLSRHSTDEAGSVASSLIQSIKTRFPDGKMCRLLALSMLVDPRYKDGCYTGEAEKKWARTLLTKAVEESASVDEPSDAAAETSGGIGDSLGDTLWDVFTSLSSDTHQKPGHEFATESVEYLKTPLLARTEDPLAWWRCRGRHLYPSLVRVARRYLSIPATQTRSERLFSSAGSIVSCRRELLLPDHVQQLVFLHENH